MCHYFTGNVHFTQLCKGESLSQEVISDMVLYHFHTSTCSKSSQLKGLCFCEFAVQDKSRQVLKIKIPQEIKKYLLISMSNRIILDGEGSATTSVNTESNFIMLKDGLHRKSKSADCLIHLEAPTEQTF